MAKSRSRFVCQSCGADFPRWAGRCDACGAWNSIAEEAETAVPGGLAARGRVSQRRLDLQPLAGAEAAPPRRLSGVVEFDRVTGGGLVPGSAVLVAGDPGIGKSTLLLQVAARLSARSHPVVYISGEEAIDQIRMRAARLQVSTAPVALAAETDIRTIIASLEEESGKGQAVLAVIDSIQTMFLDQLESAPGTLGQVRAATQELIRLAKRCGMTVLLVGHVTKEGMIAGPKVLEHMVDTVLYFEGERGHQFRILRAVKNRFGPSDEIGVFEMTETGLEEVSNPSALFLAERRGNVSGSAVFAGMEGTRPVLVEIQALLAPTTYGTPRRAVVGWDGNRLAMVMAVLETRCNFGLGGYDVYLNVAGGLRISEPAADLAVAAALVSSVSGQPIAADTILFGEIGLSGEVRPVGQSDSRLKEAAKLGFTRALVPSQRRSRGASEKDADTASGLQAQEIPHLQDLLTELAVEGD